MAEHYFSRDPSSPEARQPVTVSAWGHGLRLESGTGVFAAGRLDKGTAVLFRETAAPEGPGVYLDMGCGYGAIACAIAAAAPQAQVWAVDVNERALRLTADNATALGLKDRVHQALPSDVPADVVFDEVWSNPPIHVGKAALHDMLRTWLSRLSPSGRAVLVVSKNLGADSLQRWLGEIGFPCVRRGSAKGFRVLEARRQAPPPG